MASMNGGRLNLRVLLVVGIIGLLIGQSTASIGDRLPEFKECVQICKTENCENGKGSLSLGLRLMLWTCDAECDYTCQHVITDRRVSRDPPMIDPVVQFHGKWPFYRILGMQEFFSVLFSFMNFYAHYNGIGRVRQSIPESYPLRKYYLTFGYIGMASWIFSMIFHTRDFPLTEELDYFAAGASVLCSFYLAAIRVFRLDQDKPPFKATLRRALTTMCLGLYAFHVGYLGLWSWDYTYNMAANVVVGSLQNVIWIWFSISQYRKHKALWLAWPGMIVTWIMLAMSLELFDFPPWLGLIDAHSLWHLGTVIPAAWWYIFLLRDAENDMLGTRLKA